MEMEETMLFNWRGEIPMISPDPEAKTNECVCVRCVSQWHGNKHTGKRIRGEKNEACVNRDKQLLLSVGNILSLITPGCCQKTQMFGSISSISRNDIGLVGLIGVLVSFCVH